MDGFNTVTGGIPDDAGAVLASGMRKRGLLSSLAGVGPDPGAQPEQPVASGDHHFEDDPQTRNQPAPPPDSFTDQAPQMAQASRASLSQQMQQPAQAQDDPYAPLKSQIQQMQGQLSTLQNPAPKPERSVGRKILGALGGFAAGFGNPGYAQGVRQQQEFNQNQEREKENSLLSQITANQRTLGTEQTADKRMTLQQEMENQRERERQASQERMFGQQADIQERGITARAAQEQQAEQARQQQQEASQRASDARLSTTIQAEGQRQRAQFANEQAMIPLREAAQEELAAKKDQMGKASADETRRADLARNMNENLDQLEEIVNRRPDLFGKIGGRKTEAQQNQSFWNPWAGTGDKDVAALKTIKEQMGMAMVGAHAMRNAQHVSTAADAVVSGFLNSPEATKQAIEQARTSLQTFQQDRDMGGGAAAAKNAQQNDLGSAPSGAQEGQTVRNKATGVRGLVRNGRIIPLGQ